MLQRFQEKYMQPLYTSTPNKNSKIPSEFRDYSYSKRSSDEKPVLSEWRLAVCGLIISLLVVTIKLYYANRETIQKAVLEPHLITIDLLTENGQEVFTHSWKTAVRYSKFWLPLLCGFLTTQFTWIMVYLDSNVPGVQPPSPFSPQKYKMQSGHTFHLNYLFAVLLGVLVTSYMYWRGSEIVY